AVIGLAEKDAENIVAHLMLDGVEYEKEVVDGKADIEVPVILKSGEYNVPLTITYILDDEEKELIEEQNFTLTFKSPEVSGFKVGRGEGPVEFWKAVASYRENDGKITGASIRFKVDTWKEEITRYEPDGTPVYETVNRVYYENVKATVKDGKIVATVDPLNIVWKYDSAELDENDIRLIVSTDLRGEKGTITLKTYFNYDILL
ncbi:MAG: hypothetical protein MJ171_07170, partial [Clostridia bacterium]|nr:hypothetical protein [Clostridia bacterium]